MNDMRETSKKVGQTTQNKNADNLSSIGNTRARDSFEIASSRYAGSADLIYGFADVYGIVRPVSIVKSDYVPGREFRPSMFWGVRIASDK